MSRELDERITREVMGVVWDEDRCRVCGWSVSAPPIVGCTPDNCSMRPPPARRADEPPPYSTDIAAAWLVVAGMRQRGHYLELRGWVQVEDFMACFIMPGGREYCITADTAPLAICRAALAAVGTPSAGEETK